MPKFEFKVIPAPMKGKSAKGVRGKPEKFAYALSVVMNEMGAGGWDYVRADTLPCEERQGLTSKTTNWHHVLVFRREVAGDAEHLDQSATTAPALAAAPVAAAAAPVAAAPDVAVPDVADPARATDAAPDFAPVAPAPVLTDEDPAPANITRIHSALLMRGAQLGTVGSQPDTTARPGDRPRKAKPDTSPCDEAPRARVN